MSNERRNWIRVEKASPCPICKEADWCSVSADGALAKCMRIEEGCWRSGQDRNGTRYYLHRLGGIVQPKVQRPCSLVPERSRADANMLHRAYSSLLARLQLSQTHREGLHRRGLSDAEIEKRQYRTLPVQGRAHLAGELREQLGDSLLCVPGFVVKQGTGGRPYVTIAGAAGLLVPVRDSSGRIVALLSRRDEAGDGRGKYLYLSSSKAGGPGPGAPPHVPLGVMIPCPACRLTEGALKADIATALSNFPTIGAAGIAWRPALDVLQAIGCRTVRLAFDADALDNANVARALSDGAAAFSAAGLAVELERWDKTEGKGIDDLLAAGKTPEILTGEAAQSAIRETVAAGTASEAPSEPGKLERLAEVLATDGPSALFTDRPLLEALARLKCSDPATFAAHRATIKGLISLRDLDVALEPLVRKLASERPPALLGEAGYRIQNGRLCRERGTPDGGLALVPLSNFTAGIREVITRDDGLEQVSLFVLDGTLAGGRELQPVQVPATDFAAMGWVTTLWHGEAVVYAGQGTRDHLRCALELLSPNRTRRTVYTHTGWREIEGIWHYLHGAGAISPKGAASEIEVSLPGALARYTLPAPPGGAELTAAVRASLALLDGLAPDRLNFPLLGAVFRAALGTAPGALDLSLHLAGPHGAGKSELASLAVQHYGPGMDARNLPGSWLSTGNALEGLAFAAKDSLFVVDDYAPRGSTGDRQRLEREADRLLRAQGNRAGRQRMRADGGLRPERPPRGLILSTGEDVPGGQSLRGRLLILEASPGDVPLARLTPYQREAAAGLYAQALAGFVRWLAPQYSELCKRLPGERAALRDKALTGAGSPRTPGIVADLALGLKLFLNFACSIRAITDAERDVLAHRGWQALLKAAAVHAKHVEAAEPTALFLRLMLAALASGRAHAANREGGMPEGAQAWGWREEISDEPAWRPQGRRVGWVEGNDLYLEPEASYAAAQELARDQNEAIPVSPRTLNQRLKERGLLASWDSKRQRNTVRRTLEGVKDREVLHVDARLFSSGQLSEPSATLATSEKTQESVNGFNGQSGGRSDCRPAQPSADTVRKNGQERAGSPACGPFGRSDFGPDVPEHREFSTDDPGPYRDRH